MGHSKRDGLVVAQVQKPAPDFDAPGVVNGEIVDHIRLSNYRGKYVVLIWYPLDFTFVCPTEIIAFNDAYEEFKSLDCELIAASCDSEYAHHAWISTPRHEGGLGKKTKIPIIADKTKSIAKSYGVYLENDGISLRGLFIIDPNGVVRQITINDLPVGRSVPETIRLVEAFQFTDKHGEVCPANWNKGSKTIIPDVHKAKAYFQDDD
ncbi:hypothetical protein [Parasitella parasitica]|uniref:thioredoxin-dependent peroxiredoxin n=1 Tax=Parasitella parasitica TaxID=35722 RepID=A0A0B7MR55_9FUNG|nr:hypothetical protein [Parasitella parasitica]